MSRKNKKTSPWSWIPTLYFAEGIPYVVAATTFSLIMYKRLGISNADAALYTSWLYLPWVIKPFWSPFVDLFRTKRWWIITMQLLIGAGLAGVAFCIPLPYFFQLTLAILWLVAFSSATHDIAADGFYMLALNEEKQSFFVGIRSTFYRISMVVGQGALVMFAGYMEASTGLEPLELNVQSGYGKANTIEYNNQDCNLSDSDKTTFIAFPQKLVIPTENITADSVNRLKEFAQTANVCNGFTPPSETKKTASDSNKPSWWTQNISTPLGNFIHRYLGAPSEEHPATDNLVGNAGIVSVKLSRKPTEGEEIILNTAFSKGNTNIKLISGERLTFTAENWNVPAYMVVQLDHQVKDTVAAEFKGTSGNIKLSWSITFYICAGLFIAFALYHFFILPTPESDKPVRNKNALVGFFSTFGSFFRKKGILLAIFFILLYRLGEAQLVKIASPFLLDPRDMGGLGLTTSEVGFVYGTIGVIALTVGGILGGVVASRGGLKKWIWPMIISMNIPNLAYVYMAYVQPENFGIICSLVAIEQFGYGFGFTAFMLYLIYISQGEHQTSHYAICTGIMALGMMLPGMFSGWLQENIGYFHFFIWVCICTIPGFILAKKLKINPNFGKKS
jgi:PAT family beta-lactamase induction signal transducer AmpG